MTEETQGWLLCLHTPGGQEGTCHRRRWCLPCNRCNRMCFNVECCP